MGEAARCARNAVFFHRPESLLARLLDVRSIVRAVFRGGAHVLVKRERSHQLATDHPLVGRGSQSVQMTGPATSDIQSAGPLRSAAAQSGGRFSSADAMRTNRQK
eukprot:8643853-Pyramimonas_sp.AAC.1